MSAPSKISSPVRLLVAALLIPALLTPTTAASFGQPAFGYLRGGYSLPADDDFKLDDDKPIEKSLRGGESHTAKLKLKANQYVKVSILQRGIDIVASAVSPGGAPLLTTDSFSGTSGTETLEWIADTSGTYTILIKSADRNAAAGRYQIGVAALRVASAADRSAIEARRLLGQASALLSDNKTAEAQPLAERSLALREQVSGRDSPEYAETLFTAAAIYRARGLYSKAESAYVRALSIYEKSPTPDNAALTSVMTNLASLYAEESDYAQAETLYTRALAIFERNPDADRLSLSTLLNNFANLYRQRADYVKAEALYRRALAIREKSLGDHPLTASALNNLALLYEEKGDYEKAEPLFLRALAIREKTLGATHPEVAGVLNNLAALYLLQDALAKVEPLLLRAFAIVQQNPNTPPRLTVEVLNNLGYLYSEKNNYEQAVRFYGDALKLRERIFGTSHPEVAESLNNLAALYMKIGAPAKAEPYYLRALSIAETTLGKTHPYVATYLSNIADLYRTKGDVAKAIEFQERSNDARERDFIRNLVSGSERQKFLYLDKSALELQLTISLHINSAPTSPQALKAALKALLQRKGRALDAMTDTIAAYRRNASAEDRQTLDELNTARSQLSAAMLRGTEEKDNAGYWASIKSMEERVEELENRISARSAAFRAQSQPVTIEAVQKALPKAAALIEFVKYKIRPEDVQRAMPSKSTSTDILNMKSGGGKTTKPPVMPRMKAPARQPVAETAPVVNRTIPISATCRYVAYILLNSGEPAWVNLGEAKPIEEAVDALRQALRDKTRTDVKPLARKVDALALQPIRAYLASASRVSLTNTGGRLVEQRAPAGQIRQLFLSPDASLNLLPFAALVDEQGKYLVERYLFTYLTSGRDLLRLQNRQPSQSPPVIIADVDFNLSANNAATSGGAGDQNRSATTSATATGPRIGGLQFEPLQGLLASLDEANTLKRLMKDATLWIKQAATETTLKQVASPAILHIATHGFFIEDGTKPQATVVAGTRLAIRRTGNAEPLEMRLRNPLLRSGLFLAGANQGRSGNDDGVLTALEAAGLNLSGTQLVVLSACDTGLGEVRNGEGVYGLRRALVLAGSQTQVISLWAVSDEGTRELMNDYYRRLQSGEGRGEALRQTQLKMLANPKRSHPFYWASFIQSGEWANLDNRW